MRRKSAPSGPPPLAEVRLELTALVPSWGAEFIEGALAGDPDAADSLICACHNSARGEVVSCLYRAKLSRDAFRRALSAAWDHDCDETILAAGSRRRLMAWFAYAAFPLPANLPETVTIWRGVHGQTKVAAAMGLSWTLRRDVAAWFAMRFASDARAPLVIRRTVTRESLVYWSDERSEAEVIPRDMVLSVEVDGSPDDWTQEAENCKARWKASSVLPGG